MTFVVGGVVPLALGLSLSVFGVALTVGSFERWYVRVVALWTALGAGTMGLLIVATIYGGGGPVFEGIRTVGIFSNVLIGGSVGGALIGLYAAQNEASQRELLNRQNRLVILNRLLHDEVMNAVTVIKGSAPLLRDDAESEIDSVGAILEKTKSLEEVMGSVADLAEPGAEAERRPVDVSDAVEEALRRARERHPDATFAVRDLPSEVSVYANHRLIDALYQLLVNGAEHAAVDEPRVTVDFEAGASTVTISVKDEGPGLPETSQEALERGTTIAEGDPTPGLGVYLVRLFVRAFRGTIHTEVADDGTTVSISLARVGAVTGDEEASPPEEAVVGVSRERLGATALVALVAGLVMGGHVHFITGSFPVIGALYGTESLLVGVLTHEFHSLVFGLMYAGLIVLLPGGWRIDWRAEVGMAVGWGVVLWVVASGIVMPFWLNLVGISTPMPELNPHSLVAHVIWGLALGGGYHLSRR